MAIQTEDLLLRLNPMMASKAPTYGASSSMDRQQLKLMRERFEQEKATHAEERRLRELEEKGRMAREEMQASRATAEAQALQEKETLKLKREAQLKFGETLGKGDIQGAHALVPYMSQLGMVVDLEGEENGLPRYSIYGSQDDAMAGRKLNALQQETPNPYLAEGEKQARPNTIDMPAMQQQTLAKLNPYLDAAVAARPEEYRESATHSAEAVRGLGLPLTESIKQFQDAQKPADELARAKLMAEAQRGDAQVKRADAQAQHAYARTTAGENSGESAGKEFDVKNVWERRRSVELARKVLNDQDTTNDYLAGAGISRMMGERGATSDPDVERALGDKAASFWDRIKNRSYTIAMGGLSPQVRRALLGVLNKSQEEDEKRVFDFLDNLEETSKKVDPDTRAGLDRYRSLHLPRDMRDEWDKRRKAKEPKAAPEAKPFNMEEESRAEAKPFNVVDDAMKAQDESSEETFKLSLDQAAAENNVDADKIRPLLRKEGGGDPAAANSKSSARGHLQIIDEVARGYVNPRTGKNFKDADEIAELSSAEQAPIIAQYFKDRGLTADSPPEDYAMAVAAPKFIGKSRETVVYPKPADPEKATNKDPWKANAPWRPKDGGDITVGSILDYYGVGAAKQAAPVDPKERARELLRKAGL